MSNYMLVNRDLASIIWLSEFYKKEGFPGCISHQCQTIWVCKDCDGNGYLFRDNSYWLCSSCNGIIVSCECRKSEGIQYDFPKGKIFMSRHRILHGSG